MAKPINFFHIVLGTIILALFKIYKESSETFVVKNKYVFLFTGLLIAMYHTSRYLATKHWIYSWHVLVVAPTIALLGLYPSVAIGVIKLLATAMIAYHTAIIFKIV